MGAGFSPFQLRISGLGPGFNDPFTFSLFAPAYLENRVLAQSHDPSSANGGHLVPSPRGSHGIKWGRAEGRGRRAQRQAPASLGSIRFR